MHSLEQDPTLHEIQHRLNHAERARLVGNGCAGLMSDSAPRSSVQAALRGFLKPLRRS
jgi:hypothetical protein